MKKLIVIAITLTAIGVAVKVVRSKRNDTNKKVGSIVIGSIDSYPDWVKEKIIKR